MALSGEKRSDASLPGPMRLARLVQTMFLIECLFVHVCEEACLLDGPFRLRQACSAWTLRCQGLSLSPF